MLKCIRNLFSTHTFPGKVESLSSVMLKLERKSHRTISPRKNWFGRLEVRRATDFLDRRILLDNCTICSIPWWEVQSSNEVQSLAVLFTYTAATVVTGIHMFLIREESKRFSTFQFGVKSRVFAVLLLRHSLWKNRKKLRVFHVLIKV